MSAPAVTPETPAGPVAKERSAEEQARDKGPADTGGAPAPGEAGGVHPQSSMPLQTPALGDIPDRKVVKAAALPVVVYDRQGTMCVTRPEAIVTSIAKADGDDAGKPAMQAVFDETGQLVGIVDPADITPVAGAGGKAADPEPEAAPAADDMTPQPPADAGVAADAVGKGAPDSAPAAPAVDLESVLKALADMQTTSAQRQAEALEVVAKAVAAGNADLAEQVATLKARLVTVENSPAAPRVFANGQTPPEGARPPQLRGQDAGAPPVDVAKAAVLKETLYSGSGPAQAAAFHEMEGMAIARLQQIRARGPQPPVVPA